MRCDRLDGTKIFIFLTAFTPDAGLQRDDLVERGISNFLFLSLMLNLERKVHMWHTLMNRARRDNINIYTTLAKLILTTTTHPQLTLTHIWRHIIRPQPSRHLQQKLLLPRPPLLQTPRSNLDTLTREII